MWGVVRSGMGGGGGGGGGLHQALELELELAPRSPDTGRFFHENRADGSARRSGGTADTDGSVDIHPWVSHNTAIHSAALG